LGVLLDAVYNHTANASVLNDIVPGYYYRMTPEGAFLSNSGCGNDVATERVMARRLISDSINHWVADYKVDGFRFDLMGLLDVDTVLQSRARAAQNPDKADLLFEGEGWKMYSGPKTVKVMDQNYMTKTDQVAVFNDELRSLLKGGGMDDRAKGFITDKAVSPKIVLSNLLGKPQLNYKVSAPGNNLQYIEAHDNLTAHDNVALNMGLSDAVPAQRAEIAARLRLGNFLILTSQGISFLHSGQESGRTKPKLNSKSEFLGDYIHNSYDAADNINAFNWQPYPEYAALTDFTSGMIAIRKSFEAFRLGDAKAIDAAATPIGEKDDGTMALGWSLKTNQGTFTMLVNASQAKRTFDPGRSLKGKAVLVDQTRAGVTPLSDPKGLSFGLLGNEITLDPLTAILIKE
jgi:pullulanase/glycogen debranching enzyme